ncbi:MAG: UvrD-helicase domain-containing protein [Granulosicoccus sp.]
MSAPIDADIRQRALDPTTSFIVQAPAGSGKTELLTRRVLTLLATVNEPEEILAITFTRKAASEMRQRVIETLERANSEEAAVSPYEAEGIVLAKAVLKRDAERDWQLIRNPQRLNLRTIDALAAQLAHRLPVTSQLGAPTGVIEDARSLYKDVAGRFIAEHLPGMDLVLLQLGNKLDKAQILLANLLANRDQWKRHVYDVGNRHDELRIVLEGMLAELIESRLANLCATVPDTLQHSLPPRLRMACGFLLEDAEGDLQELPFDMQAWLEMQELPGAQLDDLNGWCSVAAALLTSKPDLRKRLTKKEGFPAKGDAKKRGVDSAVLESHKQSMLDILEQVREAPEFVAALIEVSSLPYPRYTDEQWALLSQLLGLLPDLLIELQIMFAERGEIDFAEMAERAQRALGTDESPTDLALSMDLSLTHILVDEFQDTSQTQFRLFTQLVNGWSPGDGRTIFAVGDPMQSIYRFRDGDVALFTEAKEQGIGPVQLDSLKLSVNFRAAPLVIDWVNQTFDQIFPSRADANSGAVPYSSSVAHLNTSGSVQVHPLLDLQKSDEAQLVASIAAQAIADDPEHQVAILVRTRGQATDIFDALRQQRLNYQSIDMDLIGERAVVRDLLSLCLALRYPHDRLHWLSLLRAPFVGLTLSDLHALMDESGSQASVIEMLREPDRVAALSADGQMRIDRFLSVIEPALKHVSRTGLMPWVESVWLQLGGPAVCRDTVDVDAAERAIKRLVSLDAQGLLWQKSVLNDAMASLYAAVTEDVECQIQVMTLHKAKGLEFDTVILPALDRQPRSDSTQLLNWFESTLDGQPQLLLAPFEQSGLHPGLRDRINRLVRKARERCDEQEKLRLLYVACTRAKLHLHLTARVSRSSAGEIKPPVSASLLNPLWPLIESQCETAQALQTLECSTSGPDGQMELGVDEGMIASPQLERVAKNSKFPHFEPYQWEKNTKEIEKTEKNLEFSWAGRDARDIGTVVHSQMQQLANEAGALNEKSPEVLADVIEKQLKNLGIHQQKLEKAVATVLKAVRNTLDDERGRWILQAHAQARSEWALSVSAQNGELKTADEVSGSEALQLTQVEKVVIDRTFVDETGVRWIVDFKTGDHAGGQAEKFLDSEQERYADQLNRYADIMRRIDDRPIKVGLYFPMLKGWREWEPQGSGT